MRGSAVHILSIQSWVAYGHVGNASAVFPLQRLGAEVSAINTVEFSNHPGYGAHTGEVVPAARVRALLDGLTGRGAFQHCDGLLSGYLGEAATGAVVLEAASRLKAANPKAIWCCDPVIGDEGPGIYVRAGIADFFRDQAAGQADLLTPNHFELKCLTGLSCATLAETKVAIGTLRARMPQTGPRVVLVTSLRTQDTPAAQTDCLVGDGEGFALLRTPILPIEANGAGDALAAVFLFHILAGHSPRTALEKAANSLHGVLSKTCAAGSRELLLIAAQGEFLNPSSRFRSENC
jgi:pyridoxine kinase